MTIFNKKEALALFLGDIIFFHAALWLTLFARYLAIPDRAILLQHAIPFSIIFFVWVMVFFISGLYEKQTLVLKSKLPSVIFNAQVVNSVIAVLFFYFIPYFGITPKTNLFIDLVFSFGLIVLWRLRIAQFLGVRKKQNAILIGSGEEMEELKKEVNENDRYILKFVSSIDLNKIEGIDFSEEILPLIYRENVSTVVIDIKDPKSETILPHLYNLIFSGVRFIDINKVYEDIFDRAPFSLLKYNWFIENVSSSSRVVYGTLKRLMDIIISSILAIFSLILYPFVALAIKIEDGGPVFITQERFGSGNRIIKILKFRTMKTSDGGVWLTEGDSRITKTGAFLRKLRIDELPQLWSVINGDMSLIGPRPDIIDLGKKLMKEIPYYNVRYLIKPGLSGWAQIKQDFPPQSVEETKKRLAYDLYYIKNRSFVLDLKIALKTIKTLLSRTGR